MPVMPFRRMNC
uniref:Uncharacterized protein n=1 Tax=Anguilla anguilla TaxID=7936 RepID=A0A0E9TNH3_ANGAN